MLRASEAAVAQASQALAVMPPAVGQLQGGGRTSSNSRSSGRRSCRPGTPPRPSNWTRRGASRRWPRAGLGIGEAKVASAEADIQAAEANRDVAAAQVEVADAAVQEVEALLEYTRVRRPLRRRHHPAAGQSRRSGAGRHDQPHDAAVHAPATRHGAQSSATCRSRRRPAWRSVRTPTVKVYGLDGQVVRGQGDAPGHVAEPGHADDAGRDRFEERRTRRCAPGMYAQVTLTLRPATKVAEPAYAALEVRKSVCIGSVQ